MNVVTFGARYLSRLERRVPLGMPFHASINLHEAFENPYTIYTEHTHNCEVQCAEVLVPPAATWLLLAGEEIYELCKINAKSGSIYGFTLNGWGVWKNKLLHLRASVELDSSVCEIASRAAIAMSTIDKQQLQ